MGNNIVQLVYDLKDLVTGKMAAANLAADRGLNNVAASAARMSSKVSYASSGASSSIAGIGAAADKAVSRVDRLRDAMGRLKSGSLGLGGALGLAAVGGAVGMGAMGIVKAGGQAQQDLIGLSTFVGESKAKTIYAQLQQDAAATPFNTKALLSVDRALISAGVNADKARVDMLGLANAISATGGGNDELARMATNMQQIKNAGQATAMDIRQFSYAGINIYQLLANATGKSIDKVKDMTVSYDLLSYSLNKAATSTGLYHDAMQKQSESIFGKWSTLTDDIGIAAAKIGMSLAPEITKLIDQWIGYANSLPELAEKWTPAIVSMVKGLGDFAGALVNTAKWLYNNWTWIKYVAGTGLVFVGVIKSINIGLGIYNGIAAISAARTALFGGAQVVAAANLARTAVSAGWATTATASYGYAAATATGSINALGAASTTVFAGISAGAIAATAGIGLLIVGLGRYYGTKGHSSNYSKEYGIDGVGYKNPLAGGQMKNGVYSAASDTAYSVNPLLKYGINPQGFYKNFGNLADKKEDDPLSAYKDLYKGATDSGDSITGGGSKNLNIHFYKGAVQQTFTVADAAKAFKMSVDEFTILMAQSIQSVKASI